MDSAAIKERLGEVRSSERGNRIFASFLIGIATVETVLVADTFYTNQPAAASIFVGAIGAVTLGFGAHTAFEAHSDSQTAAALEGALAFQSSDADSPEAPPEAPIA
jgi:hypothetical protein